MAGLIAETEARNLLKEVTAYVALIARNLGRHAWTHKGRQILQGKEN